LTPKILIQVLPLHTLMHLTNTYLSPTHACNSHTHSFSHSSPHNTNTRCTMHPLTALNFTITTTHSSTS